MSAPEPIRYLERTRDWYLALGYDTPYTWAKQDTVAFTPPTRPVHQCTLAIVTTAAPIRPDAGDQGPNAPYNGKAKFFDVYAAPTDNPPALGISHVAIDRAHTTAEDTNAFFPLAAFARCVNESQLGAVSARFYGLPTDRSVRRTRDVHAPALLALCQADQVDIVVLVANCPVCHQSCALVANHLEAAGLSTVVLGCALDIVEHVGAPRFVFSDLPLGNAGGPPWDREAQDHIAGCCLAAAAGATHARSITRTDILWPGATQWREDYANPATLSPAQLAEKRAEFERVKRERDAAHR